jgi:hypothetical protein
MITFLFHLLFSLTFFKVIFLVYSVPFAAIIIPMFRQKRINFGPGFIGVKPKNYRFIAMHVIEHFEDVTVWIDEKKVEDFSEDGPITQNVLSNSASLLIKVGEDKVLGFRYFPDQMWFSLKYKDIAAYCASQGWLKIDKHSRHLLTNP